jgi:hypothetical protein
MGFVYINITDQNGVFFFGVDGGAAVYLVYHGAYAAQGIIMDAIFVFGGEVGGEAADVFGIDLND